MASSISKSRLNEFLRNGSVWSYSQTSSGTGYDWAVSDGVASVERVLAGFDKEEVDISVSGRTVKVTASNSRRDVGYTLSLPVGSNAESLTASLDKGILTLAVNFESTSIRKVDIL